ncbi:MAG: ABC transporter ATP-binding protein, partial [Deltaproteobacteria bacterium]|nr:ABC transporter ATP-binding protein [Deltaproteobacteria bacterium]
ISVDQLSPGKRKTGYLFQDLNLFPHLTVASNIAYSLKIQKQPQNEVESRIEELLGIMKIKHLASRYPGKLSGGEKTTGGSGQGAGSFSQDSAFG